MDVKAEIIDVIKVVSLHTPYVKVHHLMDEQGEILCGLNCGQRSMRFRLLGSRPFDYTRPCVACECRLWSGSWRCQ